MMSMVGGECMETLLNFRESNPNGGASEGIAEYTVNGDANSVFIPLKGERVIFNGRHFTVEERWFTYEKLGKRLEILFRCKEVH